MNFYDLTVEDLSEFISGLGVERYRAKQLYKWIYNKGVRNFDSMTDIPKKVRNIFFDAISLDLPEIKEVFHSKDRSVKFLFSSKDGECFEGLFIPEGKRQTLCVSTQVGCRMGCKFCITAKIGLRRNLSAWEIVGQVIKVREYIGNTITNIVLMGMGEPLDNLENVNKALKILKDPNGLDFSWRKITLSTVGLLNKLIKMEEKVNIAISLNAPNDEKRDMLMPVNRVYGVRDIIDFSREFLKAKKRERITFEYILIKDINDSLEDAKLLKELLNGIRCKINLIPYNESSFFQFKRPPLESIQDFQSYLLRNNFTAIIRQERGTDVFGGCGQLGMSIIGQLQG